MKGKTNQLRAGVILSYLSQLLQVLVTVFYTPIMLRLLGQSEYGLYQLAFSIVSYLSLFTFGFSSSYVKFYSNCIVEDDADRLVARLNGMFFIIFSVLGFVVLLFGIILIVNTETVLGGNLTVSELSISRGLLGVMIVNCALNFPTIVFNNYIIAKEKFICLQTLNLFGIVLNPCLTFPMLLMGYKSISLAIVLLLTTIMKLAVSAFYCFKKIDFKMIFGHMNFSLFRNIGSFSFFIFLESIVSMVNISLDRFLLGKMVGSTAVAIYAVGGQINTLYATLSTSISSVFTPRINLMVTEKNKDKELSELFIRVGKIQYSVLLMVLLGFATFGQRFMILWAGKDYAISYYVAIILIFPNTINLIQNVGIEIQRAKGMQAYRSIMYSIIAILNIIISILLIRRWGECGAAMGTCIAWLVGSGLVMNWFYAKYVCLDVSRFWKEIFFMSRGCIPLVIIAILLQKYINNCVLYMYFLLIMAFTFMYVFLMYFWGLRQEERQLMSSYLKKFFKK
ncbi:MAG: oligosaccharide flippase family protein [Lachnospiraceae bacterium]|jgi:Membrane protein involved in the export of O-antigen and teichoic acid|nr:oligosaccharide flippase family protein [Lachnospiraceae bacterium]